MSDTPIRTPAWGVTNGGAKIIIKDKFQFAPPRGG